MPCHWFLKGMSGADKKAQIWINKGKCDRKELWSGKLCREKFDTDNRHAEIQRNIGSEGKKMEKEKWKMHGEMKMKNSDMDRN